MLLLDHQSRSDATGFQQNGDTGKLVHGLLGWNKLAPESMALYQASSHSDKISFRVANKPAPEARMWMIEGIAGGIQPGGTTLAPTMRIAACTGPPRPYFAGTSSTNST